MLAPPFLPFLSKHSFHQLADNCIKTRVLVRQRVTKPNIRIFLQFLKIQNFPDQDFSLQQHQHHRNDEVAPFEQLHQYANAQTTLSVTENSPQPQVDNGLSIEMNGTAPDRNTLIGKWMDWKKTVQKHSLLDSLDFSCYLFDYKKDDGVWQWKRTVYDGYKLYQAERQGALLWRCCSEVKQKQWHGAAILLKFWQKEQKGRGLIKLY